MNPQDIPTNVVYGKASFGGRYGAFKLELRVNTEPGWEPTKEERYACYEAESRLEAAFMKARLARDPKTAETMAAERAQLIGCFPEPIFVETIPNGYDSTWHAAFSPWYVVTTRKGRITIGWRKRVIQISWDECVADVAERLFPDEDVTKSGCMIHAWSVEKAREYIAKLLGTSQAPENQITGTTIEQLCTAIEEFFPLLDQYRGQNRYIALRAALDGAKSTK